MWWKMQHFTKTNPIHVHKIFWSSKKTYDEFWWYELWSFKKKKTYEIDEPYGSHKARLLGPHMLLQWVGFSLVANVASRQCKLFFWTVKKKKKKLALYPLVYPFYIVYGN